MTPAEKLREAIEHPRLMLVTFGRDDVGDMSYKVRYQGEFVILSSDTAHSILRELERLGAVAYAAKTVVEGVIVVEDTDERQTTITDAHEVDDLRAALTAWNHPTQERKEG